MEEKYITSDEFGLIALAPGEEESDEEFLAENLSEWRELALEEAILKETDPLEFSSISDKPWGDFSQADYSLEQWHNACLIHGHEGGEYVKSDCKLPILEPSGTLNKNAVHAAAARINQVDASPDEKKQAAKKLISAYRQLKEKPPASLLKLGSVETSATTDARDALETYEFHLQHSGRAHGDHDESKHGAWSPYNPHHNERGKNKGPKPRAFNVNKDKKKTEKASQASVQVYSEPAENTTKFIFSLSSGRTFFYNPSDTTAAEVVKAGKESGAISEGESLALGSYDPSSGSLTVGAHGSSSLPATVPGAAKKILKKYFAKYNVSWGGKKIEFSREDDTEYVFASDPDDVGPDYLKLESELTGKEWLEAALYREQAGYIRADLAQNAKVELSKTPSASYPGLERVPGIQNWVDKVGGLPDLIERSAKHIHYEAGRSISAAIATAVNWAKKMCATGRAFGGQVKVSPKAQQAACQAVAQWEAKKGKSHASEE